MYHAIHSSMNGTIALIMVKINYGWKEIASEVVETAVLHIEFLFSQTRYCIRMLQSEIRFNEYFIHGC
jgi:hypothetical protein